MAKSLDEKESADVAPYFSSQQKMQGDRIVKSEIGKVLFSNGDAVRNILPCTSCHGTDGKGVDDSQQTITILSTHAQAIPVIGGQNRDYLVKQLYDWRSGERHNSDGQVMNLFTKALTDAEIEALADYISAR